MIVDHPAGHLQGDARLQPGLEVGAQRVAHEGGAGQGAAAVGEELGAEEPMAAWERELLESQGAADTPADAAAAATPKAEDAPKTKDAPSGESQA